MSKRIDLLIIYTIVLSCFLHVPASTDKNNSTKISLKNKIEWIEKQKKKFTIIYTSHDSSTLVEMEKILNHGINQIENFFSEPFRNHFKFVLHPNRHSLDEQWRHDWNLPDFQSQCWMIGSGVAHRIDFLSPRVWQDQACEHDPKDKIEIEQLIIHELVHVFHGQHNPVPNFTGLEPIGWFLEGLAVFISGQLDSVRVSDAAKIVSQKNVPHKLVNAWKGEHRYGVCGSLIQYIDQHYGGETIFELLSCIDQEGILSILQVSEKALLESWKKSLLRR